MMTMMMMMMLLLLMMMMIINIIVITIIIIISIIIVIIISFFIIIIIIIIVIWAAGPALRLRFTLPRGVGSVEAVLRELLRRTPAARFVFARGSPENVQGMNFPGVPLL